MLNLGCVALCDTINTMLTADATGEYSLTGIFNGRIEQKVQSFEIGDPINFDTFGLPENYLLEMDVKNTTGDIVETVKFTVKNVV